MRADFAPIVRLPASNLNDSIRYLIDGRDGFDSARGGADVTEIKRIFDRPVMSFAPGKGLLRAEHFQIAYVTTDLLRAAELFRERYGIRDYADLAAPTPDGGQITIKLAWIGGTMIELIEAAGPGTEFYTERLPAEGFSVKHHHLAYVLHSEDAWAEMEAEVARLGLEIVFRGDTPGFLRFCYVAVPELGHYLEYFFLDSGGVAFFESIPAS